MAECSRGACWHWLPSSTHWHLYFSTQQPSFFSFILFTSSQSEIHSPRISLELIMIIIQYNNSGLFSFDPHIDLVRLLTSVPADPTWLADATIEIKKLSFGLFNVNSLTNKGFYCVISWPVIKFDFLCLTDLTPTQWHGVAWLVYTYQPCAFGRGRSVVVVYNKKWKGSSKTILLYASFESIVLQISGPTTPIYITVYCLPKLNNDFSNSFSEFLQWVSSGFQCYFAGWLTYRQSH